MVVLNEKDILVPPPPYFAVERARSTQSLASTSSTSRIAHAHRRTFATLPSHVLLLIVYKTLPENRSGLPQHDDELVRRTTRTLYWMATNLRLVNRGFYLASMHLLRSTYLPQYTRMIKAPYSSDPFPHTSQSSAADEGEISVVTSSQRESQILDRFLLFQLHEDVFVDDSSLHLERSDTLRDLFDFMQPRARLEDLVRDFGVSTGLVIVDFPPTSTSVPNPTSTAPSLAASTARLPACPSMTSLPPPFTSTTSLTLPSAPSPSAPSSSRLPTPYAYARAQPQPQITLQHPYALPFAALSASFSPRRVGLVLAAGPSVRRRTVVDIPRDRAEPLERCASRLMIELKAWLERGGR